MLRRIKLENLKGALPKCCEWERSKVKTLGEKASKIGAGVRIHWLV